MNKYIFIIIFFAFNILSTEINEFSFVLKPSTIPNAGIGVFATHDIEKDSLINFFPKDYEFRILHKDKIPAEFIKLCESIGNNLYRCAQRFDCIETSWYLNHSNSPNIEMVNLTNYKANRDIKKDEEIFIDYNQLNEPEEDKEEYYKNRDNN